MRAPQGSGAPRTGHPRAQVVNQSLPAASATPENQHHPQNPANTSPPAIRATAAPVTRPSALAVAPLNSGVASNAPSSAAGAAAAAPSSASVAHGEHVVDGSAPASAPTTTPRKATGRGIGWNQDECLAVARAGDYALNRPAVGASMRREEMGEAIRDCFIQDSRKPASAGQGGRHGGPTDERRWEGRSPVACLERFEIIRKECQKYNEWYKFVVGWNLTGLPNEDESKIRITTGLYNKKLPGKSVAYDVANNPNYDVGKDFAYLECWRWFLEFTSQLDVAGDRVDTDLNQLTPLAEEGRVERPEGVKSAKRRGRKRKETEGDLESKMEASVEALAETVKSSSAKRDAILQRQLQLDQERFDWEKAMKLFGEGSGAPQNESDRVLRLLRAKELRKLEASSGAGPSTQIHGPADEPSPLRSNSPASVGSFDADNESGESEEEGAHSSHNE